MKRMTCFVMALALVLGLAQCKKEQLKPENEGEKVTITLDVKGDDNAKVDVDPPYVTFESGDEIQVACNGHHVGTLTHDGTKFKGDLTNVTPGQPLYFYFFGNVSPQYFGVGRSNCTVYIGDQTGDLPVISMGPSIDATGKIVNYQDGTTSYTARLHNKCSLMKFNVTTPSTAPICIDGMNNFVTVNFGSGNDGFSYSQKYDGVIKMKGQEGTYWAIVLPQGPVAEGDAYTEDYGYTGTHPAIGKIEANKYYSAGVDMIVNDSHNLLATPLTFEAKTAGATVKFKSYGSAPSINSLEISINGGTWEDYTLGDEIPLPHVGDKVMFRGTNDQYATSPSDYHKFSLGGACYVYGNIMSLVNSTNFASLDRIDSRYEYAFGSLFYGCTELYTHPIKTLKLPATDLANYCYQQMFYGCTHLTVAPVLPADVLKTGCYQGMFQECTSLEEAPKLPALVLVSNCYSNMFNGCVNLRIIKCLATSGINSLNSTSSWMSNAGSNITSENPPMFYRNLDPEVPVVEDPDDTEYEAGTYWPIDNNGIPTNWEYEE